jgi:hypothetical protein
MLASEMTLSPQSAENPSESRFDASHTGRPHARPFQFGLAGLFRLTAGAAVLAWSTGYWFGWAILLVLAQSACVVLTLGLILGLPLLIFAGACGSNQPREH